MLQRSAREVLDEHLRLAQEWDWETDQEGNFSGPRPAHQPRHLPRD